MQTDWWDDLYPSDDNYEDETPYGVSATKRRRTNDDLKDKNKNLVPNPAVYRKPIRFVSSGVRIIGDKVLNAETKDEKQQQLQQQRRKSTIDEELQILKMFEMSSEGETHEIESNEMEIENEEEEEQVEEVKDEEEEAIAVAEEPIEQAEKPMLSNADFASMFFDQPVQQQTAEAPVGKKKPDEHKKQPEKLPQQQQQQQQQKNKRKSYIITESKRKVEEKAGTFAQSTETKKEIEVKKDKQFGAFLDDIVGNNVVKMMKNMGYDFSGGLGREGEGIVNPIKVIHTGKHQAVIVSDHHIQKTKTMSRDEEEQDETQKAENEPKTKRWKKDLVAEARGINRKQKTIYQTAEELLNKQQKQAQRSGIKAVPYEIIDMTGAEARVLSSLNELRVNGPVSGSGATSRVLPELQYNIRELVGMSEAAIQDLDRKVRHEKDKFSQLDQQRTKLEETTKRQQETVSSFREVLNIVSKCFERLSSTDNQLSLDTLHEVFQMIQNKHRDIYFKYDIGQCAIALAGPLIKHRFENWNPFENPTLNISLVEKWKQLLSAQPDQKEEKKKHSWRKELLQQTKPEKEDYYEKLVEDVILPKVRYAFKYSWDPIHQCDQAVTLVEQFIIPLLPEPMMKHIIDHLVLPKIASTVENNWESYDLPLIHTWIHPWLPLFRLEYKSKMEQFDIFPTIRRKMNKSLQNWNPADPMARKLLAPWKSVFDSKEITGILTQMILPRLTTALRDKFEVDPADQDLTAFQQVMSWSDVLPSQYMVSLLENEFFPKWNIVLYEWLCQPEKDFQQIHSWYHGWKSMFPQNVADSRKVQMQFARAMDMINQAFSGQEIIPSHTLPPPSTVIQSKSKNKTKQPQKQQPVAQYYELSFKELIEQFAAQNDYVFMPKEGKANGKQLYNFAGLSTYIDNDCLYLKDASSGVWKPVTLEEYIQRVEEKKKAK